MALKRSLVLAGACLLAFARAGVTGGLSTDASDSSFSSSYDLELGVDTSSSGGTVVATPATKVLSNIANLENILLKLIYKGLDTAGKTLYYLEKVAHKELGSGGEDHYKGMWYDVGAGSYAEKDTLYALEKALASVLKEIGGVVRKKLQVAFGHATPSVYSYQYVDNTDPSADSIISGQWYDDEANGVLTSSPVKSKYYTSYPVFLPKYEDFLSSPWKLDVGFAKDKLKAIKDLLYALKKTDYKTLQLIKQLKDTLKALKAATDICESTSAADYSDSSSSGLGAEWDDSSSGASSGLGASPDHVNVKACARAVRLNKVAAHLEKELAAGLKSEGKLASKLTKLAFTLTHKY